MKFNVYSEIGKLKAVMLHRPGYEVENLTPDSLERLLFDDIPYLEVAREEHDGFAQVLRDAGVEVYYLVDLVAESIADAAVKEKFIDQFIAEANLESEKWAEPVKEFYQGFKSDKEMIEKMIAGIKRTEIDFKHQSLYTMASKEGGLVVDPMPNLYFARDPYATIGSGVSINKMKTVTRNRETIFAQYIFTHHPKFKNVKNHYYERDNTPAIEGGDILVLSEKVLAVGISARTDADAIEEFARNVFKSGESFTKVLAFDIPKIRAFMHLDTVFTMLDTDKFTIHPAIEGPLSVFTLEKTSDSGDFKITEETAELSEVLANHLEVPKIELIRCGGESPIDSAREQWNDGSNTLAIAPGEVVVYSRNHVTNQILEEKGVKLHKIKCSEISRGRGGPRCMSMPLIRE